MKYIELFEKDFGHRDVPKCPKGDYRLKCPSEYGYEEDDYICDYMPSCKDCWQREVSE